MPDQIEVDIPKSQSKSLLPTKEQHPSTLDLKPTPGLLGLHEDCKNFEEAVNQAGYFIGRVLGMRASLSGDGKSKYRLPHLNMEPGQYLEDYVIYAALDESATRMSTQDPEKVFFEMSKLTSGAQSKFEFDKNDPEKVKIWKKYLSTMTQHVVLAPKYASSIVSSAPKAGTRIKIYLFQPHQISPGTIIHGLYEQEYDENIFSTGLAQLEEFFKGFNQFLTKAADEMQKAFRDSRQNVPSANQQETQSNSPTEISKEIAGTFGAVSDPTWPPRDVVSEYIGNPSNPSAETYNRIINQFNVDTNPRYISRMIPGSSKKVTFCNIFVADVTWAMGTPLPWQIDQNGDPQPMAEPFKKGWSQLGVDGMLNWLTGRGQAYAWREAKTAQEAQDNANKGLPTVAIYFGERRDGKKVHHVGLVRPGVPENFRGEVDPRSAQAGFSDANSGGRNNIPISGGFGSSYPGFPRYFSCFNNNRYVTPTQEQLDRFNTTTGGNEPTPTTEEEPKTTEQENPQETSSEEQI